MNVLIACEESQVECMAFRRAGHNAFSCDIQDCSGGFPEYHIKGDVFSVIEWGNYDFVIGHPPCTYLTNANNQSFSRRVRSDDFVMRYEKLRKDAFEFFMRFVHTSDVYSLPMVLENPVGYINTHFRLPDIIVDSADFYPELNSKTLQYWCINCLLNLFPTRVLSNKDKNMNWTQKISGSKKRSKSFPGVASAMAQQWSYVPYQFNMGF